MKNSIKTKTIVGFILIVIIILVLLPLLQNTPGVNLSCSEGKVLGFKAVSTRLFNIATPPEGGGCAAEITVKDSEGKIICRSTDKTGSVDKIVVGCKNLKDYKGTIISISFFTNSTSYGQKSGNEELLYGK